MSGAITLAPAGPEDTGLLTLVYAESRAEEMAQVPWSEAQKAEFLRFQFEAQDRHYREHYPNARFDLILEDGRPIGRLYRCDLAGEIRLMDIALLAVARGRGIGTALMGTLLAEATERGLPVTLHVEADNPARRLYRRLGFRDLREVGVYRLMRWEPDQLKTAS